MKVLAVSKAIYSKSAMAYCVTVGFGEDKTRGYVFCVRRNAKLFNRFVKNLIKTEADVADLLNVLANKEASIKAGIRCLHFESGLHTGCCVGP